MWCVFGFASDIDRAPLLLHCDNLGLLRRLLEVDGHRAAFGEY